MSLLRPTPWTSQPQVACEIDWGNPITRGLVFASNHATDLRNVATNTSAPTLINSPAKVSYQAGRAFNFNSGSTQGIDYGNSALLNPQAFTLFSQFQINAALGANDEYMLLSRDDASLGRAYVLSLNGSSNWGVRAYINGGGASVLAENTQPSVMVPHTAAYSLSAGEVKLYRDGLKLASATGAGSVATTTGNTQVGKRTYSGYPGAMNGYIGLSLIFNRAISDAEIKSLSENPWQIFKPLPRRIFAPVATSSDILGTLSVTEGTETLSASGTVTGAASVDGTASLTESAETVTASGAVLVSGSSSTTNAVQSVVASGAVAISGTASLTETAETVSALGAIAIGGTASIAPTAQTLSAFATAAFPTIARPASDVSNAGWTPSTGSDLYAMLDEVAPDDADYISTSSLGAVCKMALNATQYPGSAAQQLSLRASSSTGNGLAVTIKDGATTIATRSLTLTPTYDLHTITLTSGEIAAITSGNLTVEMTSI